MLNSGNDGPAFESSQGFKVQSLTTRQFLPEVGGELSNSGNDQYNSRSSQGCNGPYEKTNQFPQYAGLMLNSGNSGPGFKSSQGFKGHSLTTKQFLPEVGGGLSNSGNDQYCCQVLKGAMVLLQRQISFHNMQAFVSNREVDRCKLSGQLHNRTCLMLNSGNAGPGFESSQRFKGQSLTTKQFLPEVGGELSNSGNNQYNSRSSQGCNGPPEKTNQFPQYAGLMLNSCNDGPGFESSHGFKGQSLTTKQFLPEVGVITTFPDEELELRNRKRKSQESQMATSESISDVLEKGSIAENVVPDAAQSMSGERRCITVPQFQFSVEVPGATDSFLLKRIIMRKLEEQVDILLRVKKDEDETIIQSETVFPHESWPKSKPSQSPVPVYVNVLHQIGNEIKIPSGTGIYYENKIEPKPRQALVSPCPQSGANLIYCPLTRIGDGMKDWSSYSAIIEQLTCWFCARYAPTPDVVPQETHDRNTNTLGHKSMAIDEGTSSSRELMVSPGADVNTLVPPQVCPKSNSSKKNKGRRHKNKEPGSKNERPSRKVWSNTEVAALVEAVKKYGIGRWQQVYNEAFKNDDTRNADDMRDKWKSLVKTAGRPREERRGMVPPDELLEEVLELEGAKEVARANGTSKPKRLRS
ncbi:hypothetical protein RHMOL_Rhmol13G0099300 [Rhododendron molle]|uniref:Uncharacterized protein n=1 Tax=Rhododendron molle TaxID=49168 RepID=A0ACC0L602_RHOML|nr:hypothetical protein RHMOL_Rhmol13G0099300 [Rhododendron molle]